MRILADIIAVIIAAFGAMFLVASWLVAGFGGAGEAFVVGVLLVLIGVIISRSASTSSVRTTPKE
jgi:predicted phage tail protein